MTTKWNEWVEYSGARIEARVTATQVILRALGWLDGGPTAHEARYSIQYSCASQMPLGARPNKAFPISLTDVDGACSPAIQEMIDRHKDWVKAHDIYTEVTREHSRAHGTWASELISIESKIIYEAGRGGPGSDGAIVLLAQKLREHLAVKPQLIDFIPDDVDWRWVLDHKDQQKLKAGRSNV
jgi:hypothetical protein